MNATALADSAILRDSLDDDGLLQIDPRSIPVRHSRLKLVGDCLAAYREACTTEWAGNASTKLGTAAHAITMRQNFAIFDGKVRNGGKWEDFKAANDGRLILSKGEYRAGSKIADAIQRNEEARRLLRAPSMQFEKHIAWRIGDRDCSSTPDGFDLERSVLIDIKTTRSAEPGAFMRDAIRMGYHSQLAFYREAIKQTTGETMAHCYLIAVAAKAPHVVTVLKLNDSLLDLGDRTWRGWWERLMVAEQCDHWPGYSESVVEFGLPDWAVVIADEESNNDAIEVGDF